MARVWSVAFTTGLVAANCGPVGRPGTAAVPDASPVCTAGAERCAGTAFEVCENGTGWAQGAACPDGHRCNEAGTACVACPKISFSVQTTQACALGLASGVELDAEAFISLEGQNHRVMAMRRWGEGHLFAWCDSSSLGDVYPSFDVMGYLGQTAAPRVIAFGNSPQCNPQLPPDCSNCPSTLPPSVTYVGEELPPEYRNNPTQLAADWDVIAFCGFRTGWAEDWSQEIGEFVSVHGKGFLAIGEYDTYANAQDFPNMTVLLSPAGIIFEKINLAWASSEANVILDCVPDVVIE